MRLLLILPLFLLSCAADPITTEERQALEAAFEESMRGAVLNGNFTVFPRQGADGAASDASEPVKLRSERYTIEKVAKLGGDIWTFHAQIQFGDKDVTLPVPVRLDWAGDTPMISVTDLGLPGLGCYTARVVFYRDSYAGMWWGSEHGGNLFGQIERAD